MGIVHPDVLKKQLTRVQLAGWLAWLHKRPRGERHAEIVSAFQTARLYSAWVEGEHNSKDFIIPWKETRNELPKSEADLAFEQIGISQKFVGLQEDA